MVLIPRHVHKGARVNKIYCSRTGSKLKGKRQMCESQRYSGGIHQQKRSEVQTSRARYFLHFELLIGTNGIPLYPPCSLNLFDNDPARSNSLIQEPMSWAQYFWSSLYSGYSVPLVDFVDSEIQPPFLALNNPNKFENGVSPENSSTEVLSVHTIVFVSFLTSAHTELLSSPHKY